MLEAIEELLKLDEYYSLKGKPESIAFAFEHAGGLDAIENL